MAILQTTYELEEYIGNKYSLVIVAAKRARQLKEGHPALSRDSSPNALSIALREVEEQKLQPVAPPEEELAPALREEISSLVSGADFDLGEEGFDFEDSDAVDDLAALLVGDEEEEEAEAESEDLLTTESEEEEEAEATDVDDEEEAEAEGEGEGDSEEEEE